MKKLTKFQQHGLFMHEYYRFKNTNLANDYGIGSYANNSDHIVHAWVRAAIMVQAGFLHIISCLKDDLQYLNWKTIDKYAKID